ncbi:MAG: D-alanine--D-alanine ligase family protein [Planctomycetota bacterium]
MAVIAGGLSSEHEVSLWSGKRVFESLDRHRYQPLLVVIEKDGTWVVDGVPRPGPLEGAHALLAADCEVVFPALHGPFGEDGTIQGFFETVGMPYVGSGVAGSALACDKIRTKRLVAAAGYAVAPDRTLPPATPTQVANALGFPVFVKHPRGGSSLEVRRAADDRELAAALQELGGDTLLVEAAVIGRELTVAVLDDETGVPRALPVAEVCSQGEFFDFENKYTAGVAEEIVPADVEPTIARDLQERALRIHRLLGLRAMSRSDFILPPERAAVYLETNTIPGLTPTSLLPQAAKAAGIEFPEVLTRLVESAVRSRAPDMMRRHGADRHEKVGRGALDRQPGVLRQEAPPEEGVSLLDPPAPGQGRDVPPRERPGLARGRGRGAVPAAGGQRPPPAVHAAPVQRHRGQRHLRVLDPSLRRRLPPRRALGRDPRGHLPIPACAGGTGPIGRTRILESAARCGWGGSA